MIPIPILVLLCIAGLFLYAVVGGLVGALVLRAWDIKVVTGNYGYVRGLAGRGDGDTDGLVGFYFAAIGWPIVLPLGILAAACVGPAWLLRKTGAYVAKAQVKEPA